LFGPSLARRGTPVLAEFGSFSLSFNNLFFLFT